MNKVLPLSRWKKEKPVERDAFSDEEDSDEEEYEYEDIVIPKKHQAKRKRGPNEATINSKRIKPNPKPLLCIPKKIVPRKKQSPIKRTQGSIYTPGPPPGPPPKRSKPNQPKPSLIPSRR